MGVVYRAVQLDLGRPVALKLIAADRAADPAFRERFQRESRLAALIDHPNVVPVHGAGEEDGQLYLVMRYVPGTDLHRLLKHEGPLEPERAANDRRAGGVGARRRARRRARAPRRQARQRPDRGRPRLPGRLRPHPDAELGGAADRDRPVARHHRLLLTRAAAGRAGRRARGHLLARLRAARGAAGRPAVPALDHPRDPARPPERPAAAAVGARRAAGLRPRDGPRAGEGSGGPLSVGGRPRARGAGGGARRVGDGVGAQRRDRPRRALHQRPRRAADRADRRRADRAHAGADPRAGGGGDDGAPARGAAVAGRSPACSSGSPPPAPRSR